MNKKQRNKKTLKINSRNRLINRRYKSTIKTITKNIVKSVKIFQKEEIENLNEEQKSLIKIKINSFFSAIDKAVKKNIFHKNKAARKKSRMIKFLKKSLKLSF